MAMKKLIANVAISGLAGIVSGVYAKKGMHLSPEYAMEAIRFGPTALATLVGVVQGGGYGLHNTQGFVKKTGGAAGGMIGGAIAQGGLSAVATTAGHIAGYYGTAGIEMLQSYISTF
jgi:hypothetical protein